MVEGVRMISGHNPESARVGRANQKRTMPVLGRAQEHTMKKPTRRDAGLATAAIGAVAATRAEAQTTLALENTPMSDVIQALASGRVTATALTKGYLARIEAYDRDGPPTIRLASPSRAAPGASTSSCV
jgi:hypothetical protein